MDNSFSEEKLKEMLSSERNDSIKEALEHLYVKYHAFLRPEITALSEHEDVNIQNAAKKILKKYSAIEAVVETEFSITSIEQFIQEYSILEKTPAKAKLIKSLNHYKIEPGDIIHQDRIMDLYLDETDRNISSNFAKIIFKWFGSNITEKLLESIQKNDKVRLVNAIIALMRFDTPQGVEKIVELYEVLSDMEFIYFASIYLWEYSKLIVISKLKALVQGSEKEKILVSKICIIICHERLQGIIQLLLEDPSQQVRVRAASAMERLEKKSDQQNTVINKNQHLSDNFYSRFTKILTEGTDFHEKLMIMNILDNLGHKEFLPIVEQELKWETNLFLISSYVKFLGKHGDNNYIDLLIPYLDYEDSRVVANCLEGLSYSRPEKKLINIFLKFIQVKHHRISSHAALALWKSKEKDIVCEYLEKAVDSNLLWKRKAALHIIDIIMAPELKRFVVALKDDPNGEVSAQSELLLHMLKDKEKKDRIAPEQIIDHILETGKIPAHIIEAKIQTIKNKSAPLEEKLKAIDELAFIASDEDYPALYQLFLNTVDVKIVSELIKTIGKTFSGGKQFLLDILRDSFEPRIIASALETMEFHNYKDCLPEIFPFLYHENPKIISITTSLLYKVIPEEIYEKILKMAESTNVKVRRSALFAFNVIRNPKSYLQIKKLLVDEDMDIAIGASEILSGFESDSEFMKLLRQEITETVAAIEVKQEEQERPKKTVETTPVQEQKASISEILENINAQSLNRIGHYIKTALSAVINEKNLAEVITAAEESGQFEIRLHLGIQLAQFSHLPSVRLFFQHSVDSTENDRKIAAIKALAFAENDDFFDTLFKILETGNQELKDESFKTLLSNRHYREKFFVLLDSSDPSIEVYTEYIFKKCPQLEKIKQIEIKSKEPAPSPTQESSKVKKKKERTEKTDKAERAEKKQEPVEKDNQWKKKSVSTSVEEEKGDQGNRFLIPALSIAAALFLLYAGYMVYDKFLKNPSPEKQDVVSANITGNTGGVEEPDSGQSEIKSDLKTILTTWKQICDNPDYDKDQIISNLLASINGISKNYKRKEFDTVKKLIEEKKIDDAKSELTKVLVYISKDYVLWSNKTNEWISRKEAEKRWAQVIDD